MFDAAVELPPPMQRCAYRSRADPDQLRRPLSFRFFLLSSEKSKSALENFLHLPYSFCVSVSCPLRLLLFCFIAVRADNLATSKDNKK